MSTTQARQYTNAERHARLSLELEPDNYPAPIMLAEVLKLTGRAQEAIQVLDRPAFQRTAFMASAYASAGRRREAASLLDELVRGRPPFQYLDIAKTYLDIGDDDRAIEWLGRGMDSRQGYMRWAAVNPALDPLRRDPRFQAVIARLKLPPA